MKKLSMILLLALLVGVAMAKPPTKQEKQAQKQAEIAAVLDVIKQGRFAIYEPGYNKTLPGEKIYLIWFDTKDTSYYHNVFTNETPDKYTLEYREGINKSHNQSYCDVIVEYFKKTGAVKIHKSPTSTKSQTTLTHKFVYALED